MDDMIVGGGGGFYTNLKKGGGDAMINENETSVCSVSFKKGTF
jgi:hypothetical protein